MPRTLRTASLLALVSAVARVVFEYSGPALLAYITMPLTMACILSVAILGIREAGATRYGLLVVVALIISTAGDMLLLLPIDKFMEGVLVFLIAHIVYIIAFMGGIGWRGSIQKALLFALYGLMMVLLLWPGLDDMRIPIIVYTAVIIFMGWRAWERSARLNSIGAHLAALGAFLFVLSDTILAINRFRSPFTSAGALVLTTYFAAQYLLALSIRRQVPE